MYKQSRELVPREQLKWTYLTRERARGQKGKPAEPDQEQHSRARQEHWRDIFEPILQKTKIQFARGAEIFRGLMHEDPKQAVRRGRDTENE